MVRLLSPFELLECCRLPKNLNPNVIYRLPKCHMAGVRNGKRSGSSIFHEKRREKRCEPFTKAQKYVKSSHLARKSATRDIPFRMDGRMKGRRKKKYFVFIVLSSTSSVIIRSADEWNMNCDWHVSTQTLDGGITHKLEGTHDTRKKKYWASPSHQEVAES